MQTLQQRISKLWTAALNLETAARFALPHLPSEQRKQLERDINRFNTIIKTIRK